MQPKTPTDVVDWARRHLGLDRSSVVARAVDLEPDKERRRELAQLQALWKDLVAHATAATVEADRAGSGSVAEADRAGSGSAPAAAEASPAAPAVVTEPFEHANVGAADETDAPPEEEAVDDFDLADLDDLAEAPSHAHDIEEKIKATFPGTELTLLPEPDGDDAGGQT
jgi:hypothetical protein